MNSYLPIGSRPGTPRTPLTPRTLQAKTAWWLATASIVLSTLAIFNSGLVHNIQMGGDLHEAQPHIRRIILKSFLLSGDDSRLLYQSKPLLVAEEDLSDHEIAFLMRDQEQAEAEALAGHANAADEREAIVRQLVAEYAEGGEHLSQEALDELHRRWSRYSISEEEHGGEAYDARSEDGSEEFWEFWDESSMDVDQPDSLDPEDVELVEATAEVWHTGRGHADVSGHPILDHADIQEAARPGDGVGFLEALGSCRTLTCLRDAHNRPKQPGQFNFPHALIIGWQKSATTSLYAHLDRHPDVIASENKEPEFFTVKCKDDPVNGCPVGQQAWYIERTLQRDAFIAAGGQAMAFEASTHYAMNGDLLADGVAQTMPWVKVIASLREPISRATSMLVHMLDIEKTGCLKQENPDLFTCLTTDSQLVGHPGPFNYLDSLEGSYAKPLQHWLDAFPRDQIRVLQYEVLIGLDTADQQLTEVKSFLGLDPALPKGRAGLDKHNLRKNSINPDGWPMRKEQYQQLIDMVRPDAERVAAMVEEYGQGDSMEWLANWERVWQDNLDSCDKAGNCLIKLS